MIYRAPLVPSEVEGRPHHASRLRVAPLDTSGYFL